MTNGTSKPKDHRKAARWLRVKDRREMAASLREIRAHYAAKGHARYGRRFCRAVLGNFYTGLACSPGPGPGPEPGSQLTLRF
jgi:hypothetical protein